MKRREFTCLGLLLCLGCSESDSSSSQPSPRADGGLPDGDTPDDGSPDSRAPAASMLTTLTLHPTRPAASRPWLATLFPLEGDVAAGMTLETPDDASLGCSVLSRWPDGSAKVMVLAGERPLAPDEPTTIRLRPSPAPSGADVSAARVAELVASVSVDVPGVGSGALTDLTSPARVWWTNPRVICARYCVPLLASGSTTGMVAIVDVHAFAAPSACALVEVSIENALIDPSPDLPVAPTDKTFVGATVRVNGDLVEMDGVSSFDSPVAGTTLVGGDHAAGVTESHGGSGSELHWTHSTMKKFRAFAVWTWLGGDPGVEVTHDRDYLQRHPIFWRSARDCDETILEKYAGDAYRVWDMGRLPAFSPGSANNRPGIGIIPRYEADYIRSGDKRARRAVLASARAALHYPINYRHPETFELLHLGPPEEGGISGRGRASGNWPSVGGSYFSASNDPSTENAHHAGIGLVGFLCFPSPQFIELAQKMSIHTATFLSASNVLGYWAQVRGRAWGMRSHGHALFVTPDGEVSGVEHTWKEHAKALFKKNLEYLERFRPGGVNAIDPPVNPLGFMWQAGPGQQHPYEEPAITDMLGQNLGIQQSIWEAHYYNMVVHFLSNAKLLDGADQDLFMTHADWALSFPVRQVHESPNGEWRVAGHTMPVGRYEAGGSNITYDHPEFDALPTWGEQLHWFYGRNSSKPPPSAGWFLFPGTADIPNGNGTWDAMNGGKPKQMTTAGGYDSMFMGALACACERGVPGAGDAWDRVVSPDTGIPDIDYYYDGVATRPDFGMWPRNR